MANTFGLGNRGRSNRLCNVLAQGAGATGLRVAPGMVVLALVIVNVLSRSAEAASPFWERLFGRSTTQYYPVGTQYVPVTSYYPVTTYVPLTTYYAVPAVVPVASSPGVSGSPVVFATGTSSSSGVPGVGPQASGVIAAGGLAGTMLPLTTPTTAGYATSAAVVPAARVVSPAAATAVDNTVTGGITIPQTVYSAGMAPQSSMCPMCPGGVAVPSTAAPAPAAVPAAPRISYRTIWYRVPVTSYRPVTTVDPATGATVTTMSPCITYTWQARRVPTTTGGGFLWRLFGHDRQGTVPAPAATLPVCPPAASGTAGAFGTTTWSGGPSAPTSPSYIIPPTTPAGPPSGTIPSAPLPSTSPQVPSYPSSPQIREPADMPPALEPGRTPPTESSGTTPSASGTTVTGSAVGRIHLDERSGASNDGHAGTRTDASVPTIAPDPDAEFRLRPIPAPNKEEAGEPSVKLPRLVNPRDRTARHEDIIPWNMTESLRRKRNSSLPVATSTASTPMMSVVPAGHDTRGHDSGTVSLIERNPTNVSTRRSESTGHQPFDDSGWQTKVRP